ncbi:hypothetical protein E2C01_093064 [Portunus trituberculatus]|uniref:Uncharacterized protein n=1 Tax=Portunus trituberculatus TaxID=210409 RepID=A0A5B7JT18_PORTR|nr:hypothetical protein [Portunus trituberculatus]
MARRLRSSREDERDASHVKTLSGPFASATHLQGHWSQTPNRDLLSHPVGHWSRGALHSAHPSHAAPPHAPVACGYRSSSWWRQKCW